MTRENSMCCSRMVRCTCRIMTRLLQRRTLEMSRQLEHLRAAASLLRLKTGKLSPRFGLTRRCSVYTRRVSVKATPSPSSRWLSQIKQSPNLMKDLPEDTSLVFLAPIPRSVISQRPLQTRFARRANSQNINSSWAENFTSTSSNT